MARLNVPCNTEDGEEWQELEVDKILEERYFGKERDLWDEQLYVERDWDCYDR